jgi:hypothetical protein
LYCNVLGGEASISEKNLLSDLLNKYQILERPTKDWDKPLLLSFGLTLMRIRQVVKSECDSINA